MLDKGRRSGSLKQYFELIDRAHLEKMPCFGLTCGRAIFVPCGYVAIMIGVSSSHTDTTPIAYTQIPILENALMDNVSDLVQGEIKAYVTKNISRKLKVFREASNLKAFNAWMSTWPIAKDVDPDTLSPHDGDSPPTSTAKGERESSRLSVSLPFFAAAKFPMTENQLNLYVPWVKFPKTFPGSTMLPIC